MTNNEIWTTVVSMHKKDEIHHNMVILCTLEGRKEAALE
jgi:hypothetical protein